MISDKERHEVAARLRALADGESPMTECSVDALYIALGLPSCSGTGIECAVIGYLADIIEPRPIDGNTSDGYHTFNELYHHRAVLFSVIVKIFADRAWKSKLHADGTMYDGMFIVGIETPDGQATYHYDVDPYWNMFQCKEVDRVPEWDGHTPDQAIERIGKLVNYKIDRPMCKNVSERQDTFECSECGYKTGLMAEICSEHGEPLHMPLMPSRCPNCEAEVIDR